MTNLPPDQLERLLARQKSYTLACVIVMVLYCCLWIPGMVANLLFLQDAERMERMAGEALPGALVLRLQWKLAWTFLLTTLFALVAGFLLNRLNTL